jgi:hypothetical protein
MCWSVIGITLILYGLYQLTVIILTTNPTDEQILAQLQDWKSFDAAGQDLARALKKHINRNSFGNSFERLLAEDKIMSRKIFLGRVPVSSTRMEYKATPED